MPDHPLPPFSSDERICLSCGGPVNVRHPSTALPPTTASSQPTTGRWSEASPPPVYRPIRAPAINAPAPNSKAIMLSPVPHPLPVPSLPLPHTFQTPTKQISSQENIRRFHSSPAGRHFLGFVAALSHAARNLKISDPVPVSAPVSNLVTLLEILPSWIPLFPAVPHAARYGNPAFRSWHNMLVSDADTLLRPFLSDDNLRPAAIELVPYLLDSFGNPTRIDYGTGHETHFAAFLYCLARLGIISESDYPALVTRVFVAYLKLMRELQLTYQLEPAGSHGVWGLDDYHFLPFVFGAAQLIDHKYMKPKSIHNDDILENFSKDYMYLACVAFVKKVKKGPFAEHSPLLDDISGVPTWSKVNSGSLKMYKAEVLEKVPIMQHFLFGSIIKWDDFFEPRSV